MLKSVKCDRDYDVGYKQLVYLMITEMFWYCPVGLCRWVENFATGTIATDFSEFSVAIFPTPCNSDGPE